METLSVKGAEWIITLFDGWMKSTEIIKAYVQHHDSVLIVLHFNLRYKLTVGNGVSLYTILKLNVCEKSVNRHLVISKKNSFSCSTFGIRYFFK